MYKISLDRSVIDDFRASVNNMKQPMYKDKNNKKHWNTLCACMDRIADIVDYLNDKKLCNKQYQSNAFDFIEFIAQSSVLIDSISILAKIIINPQYDIKTEIAHPIIFKSKKFAIKADKTKTDEYYDKEYFEYIRSICATHPTNTTRHKVFHSYGKGEVSPFIVWDELIWGNLRNDNAELHARIYANGEPQNIGALPIYLSEIFDYVKWNYHNLVFLSEHLSEKEK